MPISKLSKLKGLSLIVGALLILSAFAVACSSEPEVKPTIRLTDTQFESLWINNAIAKFIIENDYFTGRCLDIDGGLHML